MDETTLLNKIALAIWEGPDNDRSGLAAERDDCDIALDELGKRDNVWIMARGVLEIPEIKALIKS